MFNIDKRQIWKQIKALFESDQKYHSLEEQLKTITADIQAALTVLVRRKIEQDPPVNRIDLRKVKLPRVEIPKGNLRETNLSGANLNGANLNGINLREANLSGANLNGANLNRANLNRANLREANLDRARLLGTNLSETLNLIPQQIKLACYWDQAIHVEDNRPLA